MRPAKIVTSTVLASLLLAVVAAPVAAANNILMFGYIGDCQFLGGNAGAGKTIKIEWKDAQGNLKSKHQVTSNGAGDFFTRCEPGELIETGDTLRTQIGSLAANVRTFTVPKITAVVDRDTNTVSGKVNTNDLFFFEVVVDTYNGGFTIADTHISEPSFAPNTGVATYTTTTWDDDPDIDGWDDVSVAWGNFRGDIWVRPVVAEGMRVWSRQPFVDFVGNPGTTVAANLLTAPAGTLRGEAHAGLGVFGGDGASFTDTDGDTVRVAVGNEVDADFASDAALVVPNITATINKTTDRVTVDCNITETGQTGVLVSVHSRDFAKAGTRRGFQSNSGGGTFLANFAASPSLNIVAGDKVDVYCKFGDTGDVVAKTFTVP
jgi:hypothetical protein